MAQMQAADFFRLRPLRNKTGVHNSDHTETGNALLFFKE